MAGGPAWRAGAVTRALNRLSGLMARTLPSRARSAIRWPFLAALDARDALAGRRDPLAPPRRLQLASWRGDFRRSGERWRRTMVEAGGLEPSHRVLDIGSGSGRIAAALVSHLDGGSYDGFDIVPSHVDWCRRAISSRDPAFRFELADIRNAQYNPRGSQAAAEYRFPYPDEAFDLAVASSVFTHVRPRETERYLQEAARTLRPEGRLLGTFFVLNGETDDLIAAGRARIAFREELSDDSGRRYWTDDAKTPEHAIALREEDVRSMVAAAGLRVHDVRYGRWPGRASRGFGQDLVVAVRDG